MSTTIIHQDETNVFRGIQDLRLIPFENKEITSNEHPLSEPLTEMTRYDNTTHPEYIYYYDNGSQEIPDGTSSFLCYCRENPLLQDQGSQELDPFKYGSLTTTMTDISDWKNATAAAIEFDPVSIYTETETVNNESRVKTDETAAAIATYLTAIANASYTEGEETKTWSTFSQSEAQSLSQSLTALRSLFRQFVNEGHPIACSSVYAENWANWLKTQLNGMTITENSDEDKLRTAILTAIGTPNLGTTYPANINLPEGAAVVQWNAIDKVFTAQVQSSTSANVNSLNRFVYPPELYYYANSGIKTSPENLYDELKNSTWEEVLASFDSGLGTVDASVNSIAINDPLTYAVGCLQLGFYVPSKSLLDATKETTVDLNSDTFPLTSLLISSQHPQNYLFEPVENTLEEYIVYDKELPAIVLGSAPASSSSVELFTNTLVLQTKDGAPVRFAMEFTNNSGVDFQGINGTVFKGTKFYLVGQIKVPTDWSQDFQKRVFTKNHITKGVIKISSLKEAYTYLPDLLDPRLEVGIELVPDWVQVTTTNVPL